MAEVKIATTDNTRCTEKTEKGRQCILEIHNDTVKHRYVDRSKVHVPLADLVPEGFKLQAVESTTVLRKNTPGRRDTGPRDHNQKRADQDAKANYTKNKAAGNTSAKPFEDYKHSDYIVPPKAVDAVLDLLRRANTSGGSLPNGVVFRYRKGAHASGNTIVQWAFVDKA